MKTSAETTINDDMIHFLNDGIRGWKLETNV